ncbi:MAG TPA: AmmeMemoRadiSam system protein B [Candidatus Nanoarchaeia archaeon]|nr:AmmeMemoRadiSam system protein B [Candidatus Nanoarchaeia archaeon]
MTKKIIIVSSAIILAAILLSSAGVYFCQKNNSRPSSPPAAEDQITETVDTFPYDLNIFNAATSRDYPAQMATSGPIIAGLVPHHDLASGLAAEFFSSLAKKQKVRNFIIIGPLHSDASLAPVISGRFIWDAGFARVENNYQILDELEAGKLVVDDEKDLRTEHSIYNLVPFIAHYFPGAKIVPLALTSHNSPEQCAALAVALQKYLATGDTVLLASVDFSHYLPDAQTPAKNSRMIELMANRDCAAISGLKSDYLDSPPALIILLQAADLSGASFNILASTNSGAITGVPELSSTSYITAYFAKDFSAAIDPSAGSGPAAVLPANTSRPLKLLFFGDIMLDRHVGEKIKASGTLDWILDGLNNDGIFQGNDIVSANLEGAVTDNGTRLPPELSIDFAFTPKVVGQLAKYDFNYFNIANNHLADQGENGIIETEKNLTALGFNFAGCRDRAVGDCTAKVVGANGHRIGFTGASMVYGTLDENLLIDKVKELASSTDLVVAQMHWGTEYKHTANQNQIELAHKLIDAGADIVIGSHPHVVQSIEIYKNKPIFYSLGNFIFDQYFSTDTQEELGAKIATDGNFFQIDLLPIKSEVTRLRPMNDQPAFAKATADTEKNKFLSELAGWSIGDTSLKSEIKQGEILIKGR